MIEWILVLAVENGAAQVPMASEEACMTAARQIYKSFDNIFSGGDDLRKTIQHGVCINTTTGRIERVGETSD